MTLRHLMASSLCFALGAAAAEAADWPCYLGANRDHTSPEKDLKLWSGDGAKVLWKKNVGTGHSSMVVIGKQLYTQGAGTVWRLEAETGDAAWSCPPADNGKGKGGETTATPAVAEGLVFALNNNHILLCLDAAKGQIQWSKKVDEFGVKRGGWALSGSPLVAGAPLQIERHEPKSLSKKPGSPVLRNHPRAVASGSAPKTTGLMGRFVPYSTRLPVT